uniref:Flavin-containing monooxygenase n=1 Tax=Kalanchoe fedtschenkoi TaxID=63787 RepID=A0A7N0U2C0_KALFE
MENVVAVLIVGAGPSGLATSACLSSLSIPHIILEKEDCDTSLWRKYTYDRVGLHLPKDMCSLPFAPHSPDAPTFLSKDIFLEYVDNYVARFNIRPRYNRNVTDARFDEEVQRWRVEAVNKEGDVEVYGARFLVVATGENDIANLPEIDGLEGFKGEIVHSKYYKSGAKFEGKNVLVIGSGNSGMEIAFDLSNFGAHTSIVVRSPIHVISKELMRWGFKSLQVFPVSMVDRVLTFASKMEMGDLSKYGVQRPSKGPLYIKSTTGRTPVLDVGTVAKIHSGDIKVFPAINKFDENIVKFSNGSKQEFDAIVLATGYKSGASGWLKDYHYMFNADGTPIRKFPDQWKGENGIYCGGMAKMGLFGISKDAKLIANDIHTILAKEEFFQSDQTELELEL